VPDGRANDEWWTGPAGARRTYRVPDPTPLPGGQGYVFRGVAPDGADVVVKIAEAATDEDEAKLRQRHQALTEHPHPRIRTQLQVFRGPGLFRGEAPAEDECDLLVTVARWVPGRSLRALGALPPAKALQVVADVAEAVEHLHDACGFVHRDLHPGNVIVDDDGRATLIDLGAARADDGGRTTTVAGVLGFIAPERIHGPGDRRTDRWGVGMLAVFALLGHPRGDRSAEDLRADLRLALAGTARPARAAALIAAMVNPEPAARPADLQAWVCELRAAMAPAGGRARRRALTVGGAVVAAGVAVFTLRGDDDRLPAPPSTTAAACGAALGEPATTLEAGAVDVIAPLFESAAAGRCATGPVERFLDAYYQPVAGADGAGVVLVTPDHVAVRLTDAQWRSYQALGETVTFAGFPVSVSLDEVPGGSAVELGNSGWLVGPRPDSYHGWIPEQAYSVWTGTGGAGGPLGFPMTGPYFFRGGIRHDFERGYFEVSAQDYPYNALDPNVIQVNALDEGERRARLEQAGDLRGRVVPQEHGPDWFVDDDGRRRWIADGAVLDCLNDTGREVAEELPGWALSLLPLGPPATCG